MASLQELAEEAQSLSASGDYAAAAKAYDRILAQNDQIAEVHLNRGVALTKAGDVEDAVDAFTQAAGLKPALVAAHQNLANVLKQLGKHEAAAQAYRKALALDSTLASWTSLTHCLNQQDKLDEAIDASVEGMRKEGGKPHPALRNERIYSFFKMNRPDDALDDVEAILEVSKMEALSHEQKVLYSIVLAQKGSLLMNAGDLENAESYLERACEGDASGDNLFLFGVCLLRRDKDAEALEVLLRAQKKDPSNWRIPVAIGTVHMRLKQYKEAAAAFEQAMDSDKEPREDETVNFNYAVCLMNTGRDAEAKAPLEQALSKDPNHGPALSLLGSVLLNEKDYEGAAELLQRAVGLQRDEPEDSSLFYNAGMAQLMLNKEKEALENFEQAAELDPESDQAKAAVAALKPAVAALDRANGKAAAEGEGEGEGDDVDGLSLEELVRMARAPGGRYKLTEAQMLRVARDARSPLERAQALLGPQRPGFLRRASMDGIQVGFVTVMAEVYDDMTRENIRGDL